MKCIESQSTDILAERSKVEKVREKGEGDGEPANEAHTTAQPTSSDDTNDVCWNFTVPGTVVIRETQNIIVTTYKYHNVKTN